MGFLRIRDRKPKVAKVQKKRRSFLRECGKREDWVKIRKTQSTSVRGLFGSWLTCVAAAGTKSSRTMIRSEKAVDLRRSCAAESDIVRSSESHSDTICARSSSADLGLHAVGVAATSSDMDVAARKSNSASGRMEKIGGDANAIVDPVDAIASATDSLRQNFEPDEDCNGDVDSPISLRSTISPAKPDTQQTPGTLNWDGSKVNDGVTDSEEELFVGNRENDVGFSEPGGDSDRSYEDDCEPDCSTELCLAYDSKDERGVHSTMADVAEHSAEVLGHGRMSPTSRKKKMHDLETQIKLLHGEYQQLKASKSASPDSVNVQGPENDEQSANSVANHDSKELEDIVEDASSPGQFLDHALNYIKRGRKTSSPPNEMWPATERQAAKRNSSSEELRYSPKRRKTDFYPTASKDSKSRSNLRDFHCDVPCDGETRGPHHFQASKLTGQSSAKEGLGQRERRGQAQEAVARKMTPPPLSAKETIFVEACVRAIAKAVESTAEASALRVLSTLRSRGIHLGQSNTECQEYDTSVESLSHLQDGVSATPTHEKGPVAAERENGGATAKGTRWDDQHDLSAQRESSASPILRGMTHRIRTTSRSQMCFGDVEVNTYNEPASARKPENFAVYDRKLHNSYARDRPGSSGNETLWQKESSTGVGEQTQALSLVTRKSPKTDSPPASESNNIHSPPILELPRKIPETNPLQPFLGGPNPFVSYPTDAPRSSPPKRSIPNFPISPPFPSPVPAVQHMSLPWMKRNPYMPSTYGPPTKLGSPLEASRSRIDIAAKLSEKLKVDKSGSRDGRMPTSLCDERNLLLSHKNHPYTRDSIASLAADSLVKDRRLVSNVSAFKPRGIPASAKSLLEASATFKQSYRGLLNHSNTSPDAGVPPVPPNPALNFMTPFPVLPFLHGLPSSSQFANALASFDYPKIKDGLIDYYEESATRKSPSCRIPITHSIRGQIREAEKYRGSLGGATMSLNDTCDYDMESSRYAFPNNVQEGLTPQHLKKAKLIFFYTRYPNANTLKTYFPDVKFTRAITSQLIKWFSNFREFFYIQMEKFARQAVTDGVSDPSVIHVARDSELLRVLNLHYNKCNEFHVPERFIRATEASLREFFVAVKDGKDCDPAWKKVIYKVICKLDSEIPEQFKSPGVLERLHEIQD